MDIDSELGIVHFWLIFVISHCSKNLLSHIINSFYASLMNDTCLVFYLVLLQYLTTFHAKISNMP